ncbi:MAG TPA: 4-hydroxythreonine-4-phosphate dehydrogenase PdxA [Kofleriaceae bacterium]
MNSVTTLGITLGDPAGIGPEITVATLVGVAPPLLARCVVYGDRAPLERAARTLAVNLPEVEIRGDGIGDHAIPGSPDERTGAAQVGYLEAAVAAAKRGEHAALVTAPISKTWARRGGFQFLGHTEMLAARLGATDVAMFFVGPKLKIALATVHRPLVEVVLELTTERVRGVMELLAAALARDFGLSAPRIGVVGLNPHAGEDGLLGDEDADIIAPALVKPIGSAILSGPLVPDAAFRDHLYGRYDALVAMYHDQGLIPVKLIDFEESVNVTLGLPIIRTSPDHGTAYDIAGKGIARAVSMQRALALAFEMLERRR